MEKIVFIHGLNCTGKIFTHVRSSLPKHEAIIVDYDSNQSIESSLKTVIETVDTSDPVWIVGHSLGGILGYLMAKRKENLMNVKGLVSISTPFGGSSTAGILKWFFHRMDVLRDLSPGSQIISEVTTQKMRTPFVSIISVSGTLPFISGENDGIVTVESQRQSLAKRKVDVKANHFEVMQDNKTVATVHDFIFGNG
jgi:pimeloyl-ACP methyl ester carboxylesterase